MLHFLFLGWEVGSRCPVGALVLLFSPPQLRKSVDATSPANSCARCLGGCPLARFHLLLLQSPPQNVEARDLEHGPAGSCGTCGEGSS